MKALAVCHLRFASERRPRMFSGNPPLLGRGSEPFTLVELLVVVGVIALLMTMLLPALSGARGKAKELLCTNQQKQIYSGMSYYEQDNNDYLPQARNPDNSSFNWLWHMAQYNIPDETLLCPADTLNYTSYYKAGAPTPPGGWPSNYPSPVKINLGFNYGANKAQYNSFSWSCCIRFSKIKYPSEYMFLLDLRKGSYLTAVDFVSLSNFAVSYPHNNRVVMIFGDGHSTAFNYPVPYGVYVSTFPDDSPSSRLWTGE